MALQKKLERVYTGNTLTQDNVNEMVNILSGLISLNASVGSTSVSMTGGTYDKSNMTITRNSDGTIASIRLSVREKADNVPFKTVDYQNYTNADITRADTTSDYALLKPTGTTIPKSYYSLTSDGKVSFGSVQIYDTLYVTGLEYSVVYNIVFTRDVNGEITKITNTIDTSNTAL
jgi:hypothetical protein